MRYSTKITIILLGLAVSFGLICAIAFKFDVEFTSWLSLVALVPLYMFGEFLGELSWNNKLARVVEQKTAAKSFSWLRVLYGVVHTLIFGLVIIGLLLGLGYGWDILQPLMEFH